MRKKFTFLLMVSTCLTLMACGQSQDDADEAAQKAVETAKAQEAQKKIDDQNKLNQAVNEAVVEAKKPLEDKLDSVSGGGQPGLITVSSSGIVKDGALLSKQIKINQVSGKGWRDKSPEVKKDLLKLKEESDANASSMLAKSKEDKTFVNLGCNIEARTDLKDLSEVKPEVTSDDVKLTLNANTILICDASLLKQNQISIIAHRLVLSGAKIVLVGSFERGIALASRELVLENENKIETKGKDSVATSLAAPAVLLNVEQVSGEGTLEIKSTGANYKAE